MMGNGAEILYYDIVHHKTGFGIAALFLPDLINRCDILLSTASTHTAVQIAQEAARYLTVGEIYVDMNSISGSVMARIAEVIESSQADFIEGAILSTVGEAGPKAAILVCGCGD